MIKPGGQTFLLLLCCNLLHRSFLFQTHRHPHRHPSVFLHSSLQSLLNYRLSMCNLEKWHHIAQKICWKKNKTQKIIIRLVSDLNLNQNSILFCGCIPVGRVEFILPVKVAIDSDAVIPYNL